MRLVLILLIITYVSCRPLDDDNQAQEGDDKRDKISENPDAAAKPTEAAADKPTEAAADKPDEPSVSAAADKPSEKPDETVAADKPSDKPTDPSEPSINPLGPNEEATKKTDTPTTAAPGPPTSAPATASTVAPVKPSPSPAPSPTPTKGPTTAKVATSTAAPKDLIGCQANTCPTQATSKATSKPTSKPTTINHPSSTHPLSTTHKPSPTHASKKAVIASQAIKRSKGIPTKVAIIKSHPTTSFFDAPKSTKGMLAKKGTIHRTTKPHTPKASTVKPKVTSTNAPNEKKTVEKSDNNTLTMKGTTFHVAVRLLDEKFTDDLNFPQNPVYQSLKKHVMTTIADVYKNDKDYKQVVVIKFSDSKGGKDPGDSDKRDDVENPGVVVDFYLRFYTSSTHLEKLTEALQSGKLGTHPVSPLFVRAYPAEPKGRVCTPDCKIQCYSYCDAGCCHLNVIQHIELPPEASVDSLLGQQPCQGASCSPQPPAKMPCIGASCAPATPCQGSSCAPPPPPPPPPQICQGVTCIQPQPAPQMPCQGASCQPLLPQMPCQGAACSPPPMPQMPCQGPSCQPAKKPCQGASCLPAQIPMQPCQGASCGMSMPMPVQQPCQGASCGGQPPMIPMMPMVNYPQMPPPMLLPQPCPPSCSQVCAPSCPNQCCGMQPPMQPPMLLAPMGCGPRGC